MYKKLDIPTGRIYLWETSLTFLPVVKSDSFDELFYEVNTIQVSEKTNTENRN